jgi:hypothetical protein
VGFGENDPLNGTGDVRFPTTLIALYGAALLEVLADMSTWLKAVYCPVAK